MSAPDDAVVEAVDAIYDRLAASTRAGCCDDRRKSCPGCGQFINGAEMALAAPEVVEAFRKAALLDHVAEIVADDYGGSVACDRIATLLDGDL